MELLKEYPASCTVPTIKLFLFLLRTHFLLILIKKAFDHGTLQIQKLRQVVGKLEAETEKQTDQIESLSKQLDTTQKTLGDCIVCYEKEMKEQKEILIKQQMEFTKLLQTRIRHDLIVDSG